MEAEDKGSVSFTSVPHISFSRALCHYHRPWCSVTLQQFCLWALLDLSHKLKTRSAWLHDWHGKKKAQKHLNENLTCCYPKNQNPPPDSGTSQVPQAVASGFSSSTTTLWNSSPVTPLHQTQRKLATSSPPRTLRSFKAATAPISMRPTPPPPWSLTSSSSLLLFCSPSLALLFYLTHKH